MQADAQTHRFPPGRFDLAISRFGTMFFADPVAAFTNIGRALRPGARLVQLVWQHRDRQEWDAVIGEIFAGEQPAPAPAADPFSLADLATVGTILTAAGFADVNITGVHEPVYYGSDAASAKTSEQFSTWVIGMRVSGPITRWWRPNCWPRAAR